MRRLDTDVLILGSGLGATAAARGLLAGGYRVALVPGVGRARFPHIDGGIVDPAIVTAAFGEDAPLGAPVANTVTSHAATRGHFQADPAEAMGSHRRYRRHALEAWALERMVAEGAVFLPDVVEGKVLPQHDGSVVLTTENDDREIQAQVIALCEGADPRIPMRVHLRPDYGPEDQLHFARTIFFGTAASEVQTGSWRTSWGMPVEFAVLPQEDGAIVSVAVRIENVMRSNRSSRDALEDLLQSPAFASLGVTGKRGETGIELVALRARLRDLRFVHDRLVMGIDASGLIDPRRLDRADLTILAGRHLAGYLSGRKLALEGWHDYATEFIRDAVAPRAAYHDDKETGYLEEGRAVTSVAARLAGLLRRPSRAMIAKR